jgi:photosystem II PsbY protein
MDIDFRIAIVLLPIIAAASWAVYNIGQAALTQVRNFMAKE